MIRPARIQTRRESQAREAAILQGELEALEEDIAAARTRARAATRLGLDLHAHAERHPPPFGDPVELPDGARILVRPIGPDDRHELELCFRHLGALSRYERFRARMHRLTPSHLRYLTEVDHDSH